MNAYHVTLKENLRSILKNGIKPRIGERSSQLTASGTPLESVPRIYLFPTKDDCDTALGQWLGDEFEDVEENGLVIIEVNLNGMDVWSDCEYELTVRRTIEPGRIKTVFMEDWSEISVENLTVGLPYISVRGKRREDSPDGP